MISRNQRFLSHEQQTADFAGKLDEMACYHMKTMLSNLEQVHK